MGKTFTVSQINKYTRNLLKEDLILRSEINVSGEISDLTIHRSGHGYFTLKEGGCQLRAAFFARQREKSSVVLKDGMQVNASGKIELYEVGGQYQLIVSSVKESGLGVLYERFLKLKENLEKEGLFDAENKQPIPFYPSTIGVITSETGAVIRDIVSTCRSRCKNVNIILLGAVVQGEAAPESIISALKKAEEINEIETVILARGGGSFEDLNCFNDESLARAIFAFKKPVISAVGHETDYTIADYVADVRAATPTAAAVIAVPDIKELERELSEKKYKLETLLQTKLGTCRLYLKSLLGRLKDFHPERFLQMRQQQLDRLYEQMTQRIEKSLQIKKETLSILKTKLKERNPSLPLEKGYAWIYDSSSKKVINSIAGLKKGGKIGLSLKGGKAEAVIENITAG